MANFSAIVTARAHLLGESFVHGTIYVTEHTHQSVEKAALIAGFPRRAIRIVGCTPNLAMDRRPVRERPRRSSIGAATVSGRGQRRNDQHRSRGSP